MLKRNITITFRVNQDELENLKKNVRKTKLSQEAYIRTVLNNRIPKASPPLDYYNLVRELNAIGNNLNQLAAAANTTHFADKQLFSREADNLRRALAQIQEAVLLPDKT